MAIKDQEKFRQELMQDLAMGEAAAEASQRAMGAPPPREKFAVEGVKIVGRASLQKEIEDYNNAMNQAVKFLSDRATQLDAVERGKFENSLRERFNSARLAILRDAGRLAKRTGQQEMSDAQKMRLMQGVSGGMGTLAQGIMMSGYGSGAAADGGVQPMKPSGIGTGAAQPNVTPLSQPPVSEF